ncbi:hypothetical protein D3C81_1251220 [compost metagenome]
MSRSSVSAICTSEASTGSVGARIAPSSTATPSGTCSHPAATAHTPPMVSSMATLASRTGRRQTRYVICTRIRKPTPNRATSTASSVIHSSTFTWPGSVRSSTISPAPPGPSAIPTNRYRPDGDMGRRFTMESISPMVISSAPMTNAQVANKLAPLFDTSRSRLSQ